MGLPKKEDILLPGDNFLQAEKQLESLSKRLSKDPELKNTYEEILREKEKNGVIERVATKGRWEKPFICHTRV